MTFALTFLFFCTSHSNADNWEGRTIVGLGLFIEQNGCLRWPLTLLRWQPNSHTFHSRGCVYTCLVSCLCLGFPRLDLWLLNMLCAPKLKGWMNEPGRMGASQAGNDRALISATQWPFALMYSKKGSHDCFCVCRRIHRLYFVIHSFSSWPYVPDISDCRFPFLTLVAGQR